MSSKWKLWLGRALAIFIVLSGALWLMAAPEAQSLNRLEELMLAFLGAGILFLFFLRVRWTMFFFFASALIALVLKSDLRHRLLPADDRPLEVLTVRYLDYSSGASALWQRELIHAEGELAWVRLPDTVDCPDELQPLFYGWQQVWCEGMRPPRALLSRLPLRTQVAPLPPGFRQKTWRLDDDTELTLLTGAWHPDMPYASLEEALGLLRQQRGPAVLLLWIEWNPLIRRLRQLSDAWGLHICQVAHPPFQPSLKAWLEVNRQPTMTVVHNDYVCCRHYRLFDIEGRHSMARLEIFDSPQPHCHEETHR